MRAGSAARPADRLPAATANAPPRAHEGDNALSLALAHRDGALSLGLARHGSR